MIWARPLILEIQELRPEMGGVSVYPPGNGLKFLSFRNGYGVNTARTHASSLFLNSS